MGCPYPWKPLHLSHSSDIIECAPIFILVRMGPRRQSHPLMYGNLLKRERQLLLVEGNESLVSCADQVPCPLMGYHYIQNVDETSMANFAVV